MRLHADDPPATDKRRAPSPPWALILLALAAAIATEPVWRGALEDLRAPAAPAQQTAATTPFEAPRLELHFKPTDFARVQHARELAVARGLHVRQENDWVPAALVVDGERFKVKTRLKGDAADHFGDPVRWSFRVRVRGGKTVFGAREFSLQRPMTRLGVWQTVFLDTLRDEGILAPRARFVRLSRDGRDLDVYMFEEHFAKHLVESQRRREGPIVRLREEALWREQLRGVEEGVPFQPTHAFRAHASDAEAAPAYALTSTKGLDEDAPMRRLTADAIELLSRFVAGEVEPGAVFDLEKTARFLALVELFGAHHSARWGNLPFYLSPVTGRLEPVGYDAFGGRLDSASPLQGTLCPLPCDDVEWAMRVYGDHSAGPLGPSSGFGRFWRLYGDRAFVEAYVRELARLSSRDYVDAVVERIEASRALAAHVPSLEPDRLLVRVKTNASWIRAQLEPAVLTRAVLRSDGALDVANVDWRPVRVLGVRGGGCDHDLDAPPELLGRRRHAPLAWQTVLPAEALACDARAAVDAQALRVRVRVLGRDDETTELVLPAEGWAIPGEPADAVARRRELAAPSPLPDWVVLDEDGRVARVAPGARATLREPLVLPAGVDLVVGAGVELVLEQRGHLYVRGGLHVQGTAAEPVLLRAADGGGGVSVDARGRSSTLRHAVFENLAPWEEPGWIQTGAVTFIQSDLDAADVSFVGARAEDALNVVRSSVHLLRARFARSASDAVDLDFCTGDIRDSHFEKCGNDCVDVSGSTVRLSGLRIRGAGDKGLSAGEASHVTLDDVSMSAPVVGVASKDSSRVEGAGLAVARARVGVAAYRKKSELGPAQVSLTGVKLTGCDHDVLVEDGSSVELDGERTEGGAQDVAKELEVAP